jgi:hypothetical protein
MPGPPYAEDPKVVLVAGMIVALAAMAWAGLDTGVLTEPSVRQPLLTVLVLASWSARCSGMTPTMPPRPAGLKDERPADAPRPARPAPADPATGVPARHRRHRLLGAHRLPLPRPRPR